MMSEQLDTMVKSRRAAYVLHGKPSAPCAERASAIAELMAIIPNKAWRDYTVQDFIDAAYTQSANRYWSK